MDDTPVVSSTPIVDLLKPAQADADLPPGTLAQAASMRTDRGVILQLHYNPPGSSDGAMVDTFHFLAAGVFKTGSYMAYSRVGDKKKLVRVWWVEELRPT